MVEVEEILDQLIEAEEVVGEAEAGGDVEEIAARDLNNAHHPYTRALVAATPSLEVRREELATVLRDPEWLK